MIIAFPNASIVNTTNTNDANYCQKTCFDLIYVKTIVIMSFMSVFIIAFVILLILGCFKNDEDTVENIKNSK